MSAGRDLVMGNETQIRWAAVARLALSLSPVIFAIAYIIA